MSSKRFLMLIILTAFLLLSMSDVTTAGRRIVPTASAQRRLALVIGNGAYANGPLANPPNDAADIAKALKAVGFEVMLKTQVDRRTMEQAIREFGSKLRDGGVGLFYFAGHGLQIDGRNYLIPVDAVVQDEADVRYEAVDAGFVLAKMEVAGNGLNIVILDACRDNPFARSFRSQEKGLAKMDAPVGSIVAYATAPGSVAADGKGRNGLYTSKLLKYLPQSGLKIEELFKQVRREVLDESGGAQVPWESSSLAGDFSFAPIKAEKITSASSVTDVPHTDSLEAEKQRIEIEKLKLQLEMERLKTEQARLAAKSQTIEIKPSSPTNVPQKSSQEKEPTTLAVVQPEPASPLREGNLPLKLALFAIYADQADQGANRIKSCLGNATVDVLMDRQDIAFAYSYLPIRSFRQESWVRSHVKDIEDDLSGEVGRKLWHRPDLFSDLEPDGDKVLEQAIRFGADLVLMYKVDAFKGAMNNKIYVYLLDVARSQMYKTYAVVSDELSSRELKPVLQRILESVPGIKTQGNKTDGLLPQELQQVLEKVIKPILPTEPKSVTTK